DKVSGDSVSAATLNQSGFLTCEAERVGQDTTLSQIIRMVSDAAATKAPIAKIADKVSGVFVPTVIALAVLTFLIWLFAGKEVGFSLARAISVLVISCPCALGLATPVAIMVGNGVGAKNGIMFKNAVSLEQTGKTDIVVLDKTGTITKGEPEVVGFSPAEGFSNEDLLYFSAGLERKSEHPLAKAVLKKAESMGIRVAEVTEFENHVGNGISGRISGGPFDGLMVFGGKKDFVESRMKEYGNVIPEEILKEAEEGAEVGNTVLFFGREDTFLGIIEVADWLKEDSPSAVAELKSMGIHVVMLTGDHEKTAAHIGRLAGVDEVIAGVLPDGKEEVIRSLQKYGKVAMVGDGINDAPALTRADMGIAIGAGTDIAIDAADVVLMKSQVKDVPAAIRLSRATLKNIHENLFWAFFYNVIGIPLASGVWIPVFGWQLNPMFGAAAMSLSSFCVVTNALRLNFCKLYDAAHDHKSFSKRKNHLEGKKLYGGSISGAGNAVSAENKNQKEEDKEMTKTMKIEGMMCEHCEARVKKALEALDHVEEAKVSHKEGTAVLSLSGEVEDAVLTKAVEEQDYKVLAVE
ncbi:MAG: metal-transporting ATPase, partial [Lachnospiraceae bacterium]|nr:metal-transporting ATPase [Lachnospiraceae bacterium]